MSIIVTNGTVVLNLGKASVAITQKNGPQTLAAEVEARLVSEGVAEYIDQHAQKKSGEGVATPPADNKEPGAGENTPDQQAAPGSEEIAADKPQYSIVLKAAELRELLEECGLTFKVGMTKADMVAVLDEYFEEEANDNELPPALEAQEPVI